MEAPTATKFPHDTISYIAPTWQQLQAAMFALSLRPELEGVFFDQIVSIAAGGLPYAVMLKDFLDIDHLLSIGIKSYTGIDETREPYFYQHLSEKISGKKVLLFDDVADTGHTLLLAQQYLAERGVAQITTATVYYKPHSIVTPDVYAQETDAWIIFPHDVRDSIQALSQRWHNSCTPAQQHAAFQKLGFSSSHISQFSTPTSQKREEA